jgi:hypothetical protein
MTFVSSELMAQRVHWCSRLESASVVKSLFYRWAVSTRRLPCRVQVASHPTLPSESNTFVLHLKGVPSALGEFYARVPCSCASREAKLLWLAFGQNYKKSESFLVGLRFFVAVILREFEECTARTIGTKYLARVVVLLALLLVCFHLCQLFVLRLSE